MVIRLQTPLLVSFTENLLALQTIRDRLMRNQRPVQIVTGNHTGPTFTPIRHQSSIMAWLVFVIVAPDVKRIELSGILKSLLVWSWPPRMSILHNDLIYIVLLRHNGPSPANSLKFTLQFVQCGKPAHLTAMEWNPATVVPAECIWTLEPCYRDEICRHDMPSYFVRAEREGVERIVRQRYDGRNNFEGLRFNVDASYSHFMDWDTWKRILPVPLRHNTEIPLMEAYLGVILRTLSKRFNFTFYTIGLIVYVDQHWNSEFARITIRKAENVEPGCGQTSYSQRGTGLRLGFRIGS